MEKVWVQGRCYRTRNAGRGLGLPEELGEPQEHVLVHVYHLTPPPPPHPRLDFGQKPYYVIISYPHTAVALLDLVPAK